MKEDIRELRMLLTRISANYICSEDEFLNEMFYEGLNKAKMFCNYLEKTYGDGETKE